MKYSYESVDEVGFTTSDGMKYRCTRNTENTWVVNLVRDDSELAVCVVKTQDKYPTASAICDGLDEFYHRSMLWAM